MSRIFVLYFCKINLITISIKEDMLKTCIEVPQPPGISSQILDKHYFYIIYQFNKSPFHYTPLSFYFSPNYSFNNM